jgi:hypothetical protein
MAEGAQTQFHPIICTTAFKKSPDRSEKSTEAVGFYSVDRVLAALPLVPIKSCQTECTSFAEAASMVPENQD